VDTDLNLAAPERRVGASITKLDDRRLIMLSGSTNSQPTNLIFQFDGQSWETVYLENHQHLPAFTHHTATVTNNGLIVTSTEGSFLLQMVSKTWSKISDIPFEPGHSATYLDANNCVAIVDSVGLHLLCPNSTLGYQYRHQSVLQHHVNRTWHGATLYRNNIELSFGEGATPINSKLSIDPIAWKATKQEINLPQLWNDQGWEVEIGILFGFLALLLFSFGLIIFALGYRRKTFRVEATEDDFDTANQNLPNVYPWDPCLSSTSSSSSLTSSVETLV
ncbi:hypothetical protein L0F63_003233, partial [Massospora cicadina]